MDTANHSFPRGEAGECNEPDEECGKKMIGFYVETDLF